MSLRLMFVLLFILPAANAANLQGTVTGNVTEVTIHLSSWTSMDYDQPAVAHIYVTGLPPANLGINGCAGNGFRRVAISSDNPAYDSVVRTALTARSTGQRVKVLFLDSCSVRYNSWDLGVITIKD